MELARIDVWFGLIIASGTLSSFSNQTWIATYAPGSGASGTIGTPGPVNTTTVTITTESISTGTDNIGTNLITYILNSSANVTFYRIELDLSHPGRINQIPLYSEPLSLIVARSIAVAAVYILVFNFIAWYALKRTQVIE